MKCETLSNDMYWYWLPASCFYTIQCPRTSSPITQSIGFQPNFVWLVVWVSVYHSCRERIEFSMEINIHFLSTKIIFCTFYILATLLMHQEQWMGERAAAPCSVSFPLQRLPDSLLLAQWKFVQWRYIGDRAQNKSLFPSVC